MTPSSGAKDKLHPIGQNGTEELLSDGIVDTQKYSGNIIFKMHPLRQNGTRDFNSELIVYDGILVPNTYWGKTKSSSDSQIRNTSNQRKWSSEDAAAG